MNKLFLCVCILSLMLMFVGGFAFAQSFPTNKGSKFFSGSFMIEKVFSNEVLVLAATSNTYR